MGGKLNVSKVNIKGFSFFYHRTIPPQSRKTVGRNLESLLWVINSVDLYDLSYFWYITLYIILLSGWLAEHGC